VSIDWSAFTPWPALSGGILIGLASVVLVLWNGRIAGISGILGGLLSRVEGDNAWRLAFILGLLAAPWLWAAKFTTAACRKAVSHPPRHWEWGQLVVGGLLVGFGTRLANGCTSGHGVCGLARLSLRSLVAVLIFMSAGMATVFMTRHLAGV
jgi:uncharacterized membrane protein YedE/YeeE